MVGVARLELAASWSRTKRATSCATPRQPFYYKKYFRFCQELNTDFIYKNLSGSQARGRRMMRIILRPNPFALSILLPFFQWLQFLI